MGGLDNGGFFSRTKTDHIGCLLAVIQAHKEGRDKLYCVVRDIGTDGDNR